MDRHSAPSFGDQRDGAGADTGLPRGVHVIRQPLPDVGGPAMTNTWVFEGESGVDLIDVGWDTPEAHAALVDGLGELGYTFSDVGVLVLTHAHRDHIGLADRVRASGGAVVAMHPGESRGADRTVTSEELERWEVPASERESLTTATSNRHLHVTADMSLDDGASIGLGRFTARVLHTPGHTAGSVCIDFPALELVATGDTLLPDQFPGLGLGRRTTSNPLTDYRTSLARLSGVKATRGLPGHGAVMTDMQARIEVTTAHHARRSESLRAFRAAHPSASIWEVARGTKWTGGWESLNGGHRVSALRQVEMHLSA